MSEEEEEEFVKKFTKSDSLVDLLEEVINEPIEAKSENKPQESEKKEEKQEAPKEDTCEKGTCPIPKEKKQSPIPKPPDTKSYTIFSKTEYHQCLECQKKIDKYHQFCSEKCRKKHLRNYINYLQKNLEE